jgi:3-isopropylmalate/(R)-2-methylmalate dehydratase large subunit
MSGTTEPTTLFEKLWSAHEVRRLDEGSLIYIDRHLLNEACTPIAFEGLRQRGRVVRNPSQALGTSDHVVSTTPGCDNPDPEAAVMLRLFEQNCRVAQVPRFSLADERRGIVHVVGPEQGWTLPGATIVCGDSHTSTHGAFGAWGFGIGISEVEQVLATQTLVLQRPRTMRVMLEGRTSLGVGAKDLALALIARIGCAGGRGHIIEFAGSAVQALSMEGRMTLCNMAIEAGARSGLVAPDEVTFAWLHGRPLAPQGTQWDQAVAYWRTLRSEEGARFDGEIELAVSDLAPHVSWGTTPQHSVPIDGRTPHPAAEPDARSRHALQRALEYMGLEPAQPVHGIPVDKVFIGSCTNGRLEDLQAAASVLAGRRVHDRVHALVVPGSSLVRRQAEALGLDSVFRDAGFEWREPGCSMCLSMNDDRLGPGERCASTSNRNFEGRQGPGGRTHLLSPVMAAAAAVAGHLCDARAWL